MNRLIYIHYYYNDEKDLGIPLETQIEVTDNLTVSTKYIDVNDIKREVEEIDSFELPENFWNEFAKIDLLSLNDKYDNGDERTARYKIIYGDKTIEGNYFPDAVKDLRYILYVKDIIRNEVAKLKEKVIRGE